MATASTIIDFFKNVTTAGTPEEVGSSATRANSLTFSGYKAAGTANTGDVKIRPTGGSGWYFLSPETTVTFLAPNGGFYRANQFEIDADNSGDGVYVQALSAVVYEGP